MCREGETEKASEVTKPHLRGNHMLKPLEPEILMKLQKQACVLRAPFTVKKPHSGRCEDEPPYVILPTSSHSPCRCTQK